MDGNRVKKQAISRRTESASGLEEELATNGTNEQE
jgi:hypothetical protein